MAIATSLYVLVFILNPLCPFCCLHFWFSLFIIEHCSSYKHEVHHRMTFYLITAHYLVMPNKVLFPFYTYMYTDSHFQYDWLLMLIKCDVSFSVTIVTLASGACVNPGNDQHY